jgi:flagellar basal body-associated protein FliL
VKKLRKKSLLIIFSVVALSAIMVISAATIYTFNFSMNAKVDETGTVTITVGGVTYNNNDQLTVDWSSVTPGLNTYQVTIHNNEIGRAHV